MRRKDREMDREFGIKVIDNSSYGVITMIDEANEPYGIPLSIVREENILYFHSAIDGKKVKLFNKSIDVCVVFVGEVKVPEIYSEEEIDEMKNDETKASLIISNAFTTEFESAIVKGKVSLIENREEKIRALRLICEKYTPKKMDFFNMAISSGLDKTNAYKIEIEEITAKRKKYDTHGEEMKWGRLK